MHTCDYSLQDIINFAECDLKNFLDSLPEKKTTKKAFKMLQKTLANKKPELVIHKRLSLFIDDYLIWREKKGRKPREGSAERYFLKALRRSLRLFTLSALPDFNTLRRAPTIQTFGYWITCFTIKPLESYTMLQTISKQSYDQFDLKGFPSWLILDPHERYIFILCDDEAIIKNRTTREVERRYELITLHEIGHARLHLEWLHDEIINNQKLQVSALPYHEYEAWIYCYAVLGLVVGIRARISRLLGKSDGEGLI